MDDPIYTASPNDFPFPNLALANPHGLQGGAYFSRLKLFEDKIFIQIEIIDKHLYQFRILNLWHYRRYLVYRCN